MKDRVRIISIIGAIFVFGFFLAAGYVTYQSQINLQHSRELVAETSAQLMQLRLVISSLKDCETGQRGYLITGDENYLEPYQKCRGMVEGLVNELEVLVDGDIDDRKKVEAIRQLTLFRLSQLRQVIEVRRAEGFEAARKVVITNAGKKIMDRIRSIITDMENKQQVILDHRLKSLSNQFVVNRIYSIILISMGFLFLAGMLIIISRLVASREKEMTFLNIQYEIAQALTESNDEKESLSRVLGIVCKNLEWDLAAYWTLNSEESGLKCLTLWCAPDCQVPEFQNLTRTMDMPTGFCLPGLTFEKQLPLWVEDLSKDPSYVRAKAAAKESIHSSFVVPLKVANKPIGAMEFFSRNIKKEDGETKRLTAIIASQITQYVERQQAVEALKEREARFYAILDTAAEGIFTMTSGGLIEIANHATKTIFNYDTATLTGASISVVLPELLEIIAERALLNGQDGNAAVGVETIGLRRDGSKMPMEIAYSTINLGNQSITTCIVRDISERKEIERRVSEFYSTVSHELRTPLTSIRGSLSLMDGGRAGDLSPRAQQLVKVARSESERLIRLINDILDIKKIESGKLELSLNLFDVNELVQEAIDGMQGFADQAGIKLLSKMEASGKLYCDKDRIEQVLANLLSNAIKFSPTAGEVVVKVEKNEHNIYRFSISDHGPGIDKHDMPKLFGLFQQLDPSDSRRKGGTGLGLAISKALIDKHRGIISVDSEVGKGSTFWFEVPNSEVSLPFLSGTYKSTLLYKRESTVLIVEDDANLSGLLAMMLKDQHLISAVAGSIKEAETYLKNNSNPDVIILDLTLPDGDGLELIDKLHHDTKTAEIPVVIVSGREPTATGYSHPLLIDWIKKPFDEHRLLSALSLAIQKRPKGRARILLVEDDQATREVVKQNLEPLDVEFIEAEDGVTAVHFARSKNPDLIVLDLSIPSLDGFEVVQLLKKENIQIPLIVYTARDLTDSDKRELTLGLTSHLIKSRTSEEQLLETVKNMLNGMLDRTKVAV